MSHVISLYHSKFIGCPKRYNRLHNISELPRKKKHEQASNVIANHPKTHIRIYNMLKVFGQLKN